MAIKVFLLSNNGVITMRSILGDGISPDIAVAANRVIPRQAFSTDTLAERKYIVALEYVPEMQTILVPRQQYFMRWFDPTELNLDGIDCADAATFMTWAVSAIAGVTIDTSIFELLANKATTMDVINNTKYVTTQLLKTQLDAIFIASGATSTVDIFTTNPLPNTPTYFNGFSNDGQGATLESATNTVLVIDGDIIAPDAEIGIGGEADATHNGIYVVINPGEAGVSKWKIARRPDYDIPANVNSHRVIPTMKYHGVNGLETDIFFVLIGTIVDIGTDPFNFTKYTQGSNIVALITLGLAQFAPGETTAAELQNLLSDKTIAFTENGNFWEGAQRGAWTLATYAASLALPLSVRNYFKIPLTGNVTLIKPGTLPLGQVGELDFIQDGTGGRTLTLAWPFTYAAGSPNALSTGKYVHDMATYSVKRAHVATFTVSIANPAVFTSIAHDLQSGDKVRLETTGALPTGLLINTTYYVHVINANSFHLSTTRANLQAGTYIITTGSQSGVHSFIDFMITIALALDTNS